MINSYYALDHLGASSRQKTISTVQEQLSNDDCAVIRNFFSVEGLNILFVEAEKRLEHAYYTPKKTL